MNSSTPKYARSIVFIALMAMVGQAMAICCVGQTGNLSANAVAVEADGSSDCHSQSVPKQDGFDETEKARPSSHDCDMEEGGCCSQMSTTLDADNFKLRHQLNNEFQFDSDTFPVKHSIKPPQIAALHWQLSSDCQKSNQAVPYYITYCSFLE